MNDNIMTAQDYPLATRCPEKIQTPTGKPLTDITLEHTWHATVNAGFVRESAEVYQQRNKLRKGSQ